MVRQSIFRTLSISIGVVLAGAGCGDPAPATLVSIGVIPTNPSAAAGTKQQFTATGTYSDSTTKDLTAQVVWTSSDDKIAAVSNAAGSQGLVTAVAKGTVTITAAIGDAKGSTGLTVANLVSMDVTPINPSIALGTKQQFIATGILGDNTHQDLTKQVTWSSSNDKIAIVSSAAGSEGIAVSVAKGTVTITAAMGEIKGATGLTVTDAALVSIEVTPTNPSIPLGMKQQFTATGIYTDKTNQDLTKQVTWTSSDDMIATVSSAAGSEGLATSVARGTVTSTAAMGEIKGATGLTVTDAALVSIEVTPTNPSIPLGMKQQFTATGIYTDKTNQDLTKQVTWTSSDQTAAVVSNTDGSRGLVTSVGAGTTTIAATLDGQTGSTRLEVLPGQSVSWQTGTVSFQADEFWILADGLYYTTAGADVQVHSDPGDSTYTTLELIWSEHDREMRLNIYFRADASDWWSSEMRTYNGGVGYDANWLYYNGTFFKSPTGQTFTGDIDLTNDATDAIRGRLHLGGLKLSTSLTGN